MRSIPLISLVDLYVCEQSGNEKLSSCRVFTIVNNLQETCAATLWLQN